jgi:hypothetical protein
VDHLGNGGGGEPQELGQTRRDDVSALVGERVDGLQVLLDGR